jgi:hypothetical protein
MLAVGFAAPLVAGTNAGAPLIGKYKGKYRCQGVVIEVTFNFRADGGPGSNIRTGTAQTKGSYNHSDLGRVTEKTDWKVRAVISGNRVSIYEAGMTYSTNGGEWMTGFEAQTSQPGNWDYFEGTADRCRDQFYAERR